MPPVLLGVNAYKRNAARLPEIRLVNRYLEPDPSNAVDQVALMPRPGLAPHSVVGDGPIRALFCQSGVLGRDYLVVSGNTLFRVTIAGAATEVGEIVGTGLVEIASDGTNTFIAAGTLYLYDGTTLSTVTTPDDVQIVSVAQFNSYFLLQVEGSGRFYWIQPGETTIDALDFATAERAPDAGVAIRVSADFIMLLNAQWTEIWVATGDPDAPFQRQTGLLFEKGCVDRETAVNLDNAIFWVGETATEGRVVYRSGQGSPQRISVFGIEERMRDATGLSALAFIFDGHAFYVLRLEGVGSFAYDVATETWSEFASYGEECWRPICAGSAPEGPLLLGSGLDGSLYTLDPDRGNDDGDVIQRVVTGVIPILGRRATVENIALQCAVGWSPSHDLEPQIELRLARDGFTFGSPKARSLGPKGHYRQRVRWERLGEIRPPGMVIELMDTDNAQTRLSYCRMNENA